MGWKKYKIGDFLKRVRVPVEIEDTIDYQLVTIRMHHKGVVQREIKKGASIGSKTMHRVKAGQFILSGIDARHGAFGVIPKELDGAVVTNDFWYFDIDETKINQLYFLHLTSTTFFDDLCRKASDGTTNRVRLQADEFYNFELYLPPLPQQDSIILRFKEQEAKLLLLRDEIIYQEALLKQLREAILREAVQGKLVPQDPVDEPAIELLKRIKAEKEALIKAGKLKKEKPLAPIQPEEVPFDLPQGWTWCRLGEIIHLITKGSSPNWQGVKYIDESSGGILFITSKNVGNYNLILKEKEFVEAKFNEIEPRSILKKGDILTNIVGASIGRTAIFDLDETANINQAVCLIRTESDLINKTYLLHYFNSPLCVEMMFENQFAPGRANLSMSDLAGFYVPLPPFAEQQNIVIKIKTLQRYFDEIDQQIQLRKAHTHMLMQAVLKEAFEEPEDVIITVEETDVEQKDAFLIAAEPELMYATPYRKRAVLAGTIIEHGLDRGDPYLGHTKFQKALYVCEHFAEVEDIETAYGRHEYGAYDPNFLHSFHTVMEKEKWFKQVKKGKLRGYEAQPNCKKLTSQFDQLYADRKEKIRFVLDIFEPLTSDEAELLATLYAVWNNLLIRREEVTVPRLIQDFYQWSEGKKKFSQDKIIQFYEAMKHKGLVPRGYGREIV